MKFSIRWDNIGGFNAKIKRKEETRGIIFSLNIYQVVLKVTLHTGTPLNLIEQVQRSIKISLSSKILFLESFFNFENRFFEVFPNRKTVVISKTINLTKNSRGRE